MADNYLEKRYEEVFGSGARKVTVKHSTPSLNTLLVKNRSIRRYRQDYVVTEEQLRTIVEVNVKLGSAMNRQALRFRIVADNAEGEVNAASTGKVNALRDILFREPARSESARAYIIVYSTIPEERYIDIDLGISLQSMALKAAELGLNCLIKGNIDNSVLCSAPETGSSLWLCYVSARRRRVFSLSLSLPILQESRISSPIRRRGSITFPNFRWILYFLNENRGCLI